MDSAIVTIRVMVAPPDLADLDPISVVQGAAISGASFVNSGGVPRTGGDPLVQGCRVTAGTLPSGLTLGIDGATCVISGTVRLSVPAGNTTITITARNDAGNDTATVTIRVTLTAPNLVDRGTISVVQGAAISGASFVKVSGGVPRTGGESARPGLSHNRRDVALWIDARHRRWHLCHQRHGEPVGTGRQHDHYDNGQERRGAMIPPP